MKTEGLKLTSAVSNFTGHQNGLGNFTFPSEPYTTASFIRSTPILHDSWATRCPLYFKMILANSSTPEEQNHTDSEKRTPINIHPAACLLTFGKHSGGLQYLSCVSICRQLFSCYIQATKQLMSDINSHSATHARKLKLAVSLTMATQATICHACALYANSLQYQVWSISRTIRAKRLCDRHYWVNELRHNTKNMLNSICLFSTFNGKAQCKKFKKIR